MYIYILSLHWGLWKTLQIFSRDLWIRDFWTFSEIFHFFFNNCLIASSRRLFAYSKSSSVNSRLCAPFPFLTNWSGVGVCRNCHNKDPSPTFYYVAYLEKIGCKITKWRISRMILNLPNERFVLFVVIRVIRVCYPRNSQAIKKMQKSPRASMANPTTFENRSVHALGYFPR